MNTKTTALMASTAPNILLTLMIALAVRLAWAAMIDVNPVSDSYAYNSFATNLVEHGVFGLDPDKPSAFWAVGTPAIYAGAYLLFGINGFAVVFVNLISSVLAIWFTYAVGRLYFNETTGRMAALLLALWPVTIQFTTVIASEIHFMAAMMAALYFWEKARFGPRSFWAYIALSGLCFAAATFIRPVAQLIPIVLLILAVLRMDRPLWHQLLKTGVVIALIFAAIAPWSARNERVFGTPVSISTNFGPNFWMGNHPGTEGGYAPLPAWTDEMGEVERADALKEEAFAYVRDEPWAFVTRTIWKAFKLHDRETIGVAWNSEEIRDLVGISGETVLKLVSSLYWYATIALTLAAVFVLGRKGYGYQGLLAPPAILILYLVAVHAVIVIADRYHMPQIPLMALMAAAFLTRSRLAGGEAALEPGSGHIRHNPIEAQGERNFTEDRS